MLKAILFCTACSLAAPRLSAETPVAGSVPLVFTRLDLNDGRTLSHVVVKSYDKKTDKLLVIAAGNATTIPVSLIPAPFDQQLRRAPASGESVTTFTASPPPAPSSSVTMTRVPAEAGAAPRAKDNFPRSTANSVSPSSMLVTRPHGVNPARAVVVVDTHQPVVTTTLTPRLESSLADRHRAVAQKGAERYYRYDFRVGSASIRVTALEVDLEPPTPVAGWAGRFRAKGEARLEYYDSKGGSFQRAASTFEVTTGEDAEGSITLVDFTRKS